MPDFVAKMQGEKNSNVANLRLTSLSHLPHGMNIDVVSSKLMLSSSDFCSSVCAIIDALAGLISNIQTYST